MGSWESAGSARKAPARRGLQVYAQGFPRSAPGLRAGCGPVAVIVRSPEHGERFRRMAREAAVVRVWDLPTRLFHWALAFGVVAAIVSARLGGEAMTWHMRFGYAIFTLLAFRLAWGFVGGRWSRFARSSSRPTTTLRYLRGQSLPHEHHDVGHTPLGAWSVLALLAVLAARSRPGSSPMTRSPTTARCSSTSPTRPARRRRTGTGSTASGSSSAWRCSTSARSLSGGCAGARTWSRRCCTATRRSPATCRPRSTTALRACGRWRWSSPAPSASR